MRETDLSLASKGITRKNIYICFYTAGPIKLWNRKTTVRPNFYDAKIIVQRTQTHYMEEVEIKTV